MWQKHSEALCEEEEILTDNDKPGILEVNAMNTKGIGGILIKSSNFCKNNPLYDYAEKIKVKDRL